MNSEPMGFYPAPELLTELFSESNLSLPPLPAHLAAQLQQVDTYLFATNPDWFAALPSGTTFEIFGPKAGAAPEGDEDFLSAAPVPEEFMLCGFSGHGIQSWRYRYVLLTPNCGLSIEQPFGGAYSNYAAEAAEIERGYDLVRICLAAAQDKLVYQGHEDVRLYLIVDQFRTDYRLVGCNGELLNSGNSLEDLLDILGSIFDGNMSDSLLPDSWMRV